MIVSLIVAASDNDVIGRDNALPWSLPSDLKRFKDRTLGHPIIMGRKTFESIGRVLPGRKNIVISRTLAPGDGYRVFPNLLLAFADLLQRMPDEEVFIIGGQQIFQAYEEPDVRSFMEQRKVLDRIYLTRVHATIDGDAFFHFPPGDWRETFRERHEPDSKHAYGYSFIDYERVR